MAEGEASGWDQIPWNSTYGNDNKSTYLGMVDIARGVKAIIYNEHQSGCLDPNQKSLAPNPDGSTDYGLMMINEEGYFNGLFKPNVLNMFDSLEGYPSQGDKWKTDVFLNIGLGAGKLFNGMMEIIETSPWKRMYGRPIPTLWNWEQCAQGYNRKKVGYGYSWFIHMKSLNPKLDVERIP